MFITLHHIISIMHHSKNNHYWHLCLLSLALAIVTPNRVSAFSRCSNIKRRARDLTTPSSSSTSLLRYRAIDHEQEEYCDSSCSILANDEMMWQAALLPQSTTTNASKKEEEIQRQGISISRDSGIITSKTVYRNKPLSTVELRHAAVVLDGEEGDSTTKSYDGLIETAKAFLPVAMEVTAVIGLTANHVH